jgi:putative MATE family efflux protein
MLNNQPREENRETPGFAVGRPEAEAPLRLIWRLAFPAIIGLSANALYHTVNVMYLGWLGAEPVSAVSAALPVLIMLGAVGEGIAVGTASYAARMLGAKDHDRANEAATLGFALVIVVGFGASLLLSGHTESILRLFGATEAALPMAQSFLRIMLVGYTLLLLQILGDFLAISEGNTRFSMWALIAAFGVNLLLDPILIFRLGMGVSGAALATLIGQMTAVALYFGYFFKGLGRLRIAPRYFRLRGTVVREIAALGIPATLATAVTALAFALVYSTAGAFGDASVAGIAIALRLFSLGALPVFGFCLGARSVIGMAWGANDRQRVFEAVTFMLRVTFLFCAAYSLLILALAPGILRIFTSDPAVAAVGVRACYAAFLLFAFFGAHIVLLTFLQSTGRALLAGLTLLAPQGYFLMPGLLLLPPVWGLDGILASQLIAAALTTLGSCALLVWQLSRVSKACPREGGDGLPGFGKKLRENKGT